MAITKVKARGVSGDLGDFSGTLPNSKITGKIVKRTTNDADTDLFNAITELTAFRQEMLAAESGVVFLTLSLDIEHRGLVVGGTDQYPVGFAARAYVRTAASQAGLAAASSNQVPYAYAGGNIADLDDHYGQAIFSRVPYAVTAGVWYRFSVFATAHSSVGGGALDGLAEVNWSPGADYNYFLTEYDPGATFS